MSAETLPDRAPAGWFEPLRPAPGRLPATLYHPPRPDPSMPTPLVLFLHGSGERGADGAAPTRVGLGPALRAHPERWPALVLFPQAPEGALWLGDVAAGALALVDDVMARHAVDPRRVLLTGLSLGGHGAWYLAYRHPERWAALLGVCGWVRRIGLSRHTPESVVPDEAPDPFAALAARIKEMPVRLVHGTADDVVPAEESRRAAAALQAAGGDCRYEELPGVGHAAWDAAYGSAELAGWLMGVRKA